MRIFALSLFLFFSNIAYASDWKFLESLQDYDAYYDSESYIKNNDSFDVWILIAEHGKNREDDHVKMNFVLFCKERMVSIVSGFMYRNSILVNSEKNPKPKSRIIPETIPDTLHKKFCSN